MVKQQSSIGQLSSIYTNGLCSHCQIRKTTKATPNGAWKTGLYFPNYSDGPLVTSLKIDCGARPKGASTKALVRCHEDFDTCHEDFVELYFSFISRSGRRYIGPAFIYFEGLFCSWKGMLRVHKNCSVLTLNSGSSNTTSKCHTEMSVMVATVDRD